MRILQLCLSDGYGGLELYVSALCDLLRQRGYDCMAVVAPETKLAKRLAEQRVPLAECRVRLRQLPIVAAARLARLLEREQIDVVHVNWARDLPLAALAKQMSRRPVRLLHSRHMSITRSRHNPYHGFIYGSLDRLIVISELMRTEAQRYLPLPVERIERVYLGVASPANVALDKSCQQGEPLRIGLFGRIEEEKGQHLLIEAVDMLRGRGFSVCAHIIGHAMDEDYLADLHLKVAQRDLGAQVKFSGFHPAPQEMMSYFDAIVLTTKRETFGLVLPEAMRCGVAVIGSNAGGVPEIIEHGHSGLLFESGSAASLADQIQYLAENPLERQRLAMAGRERADQMFSQERHMQQLEQILARLMKAGV